jgi:hypothetical protein
MDSSRVPPDTADTYITDARVDGATPSGWLLFLGLMFYLAGIWNFFEGLYVLVRSSDFRNQPVFGELRFWAVVWMILGILLIAAGSAMAGRRSWARWFGIVVVGLSAIQTMLTFASHTWWSVVILGVDFLILYALTVRWQRPASA